MRTRGRPTSRIAVLVLLCGSAACSRHRQEDVRFVNGDVALAGTLVLPSGPGPHPAVVFVHGDGADTRDGYRFLAERFAKRGVAALIYDKRGAGASSGDWQSSRFTDLAADALAAVDLLVRRGDIDSRRIGLWGGSQGGWIAPLAASRSRHVHFLIVTSGPATGPAALATYKSVRRVRDAGFSDGAVRQVEALMNLQFRILRTGTGWSELDMQVQQARQQPWYRHVAVMRHSPWESSWMSYGADIDFDPVPIFEALNIPALFLLGERDPETPVAETAAALLRIGRDRKKDFTVRVFDGADHQIELPRFIRSRPRYAPGYIELMVHWTLERGSRARNP